MHVWTQADFLRLILAIRDRAEGGFDLEAAARVGIEFLVVLRKAGPLPAPTAAAVAERGAAGAADPRGSAHGQHPRDRRRPRAPDAAKDEAITAPAPGPSAPLAIEARDLEKSFSIPTHRVDSLKERAVRPFAARDVRILRALDGVSFDIHQGEFFGIVGRNGSGKSTLLKLLASIYRADAGTIRLAGRLAPFIELGVGFNPELTARENVVLNGVMMGLTPKETRDKLDSVIEFAELEEFADLKLKNFSSGMQVRLAFSVMLEADADVLLIDEVLAVGDAAFQQKCADAFHSMKAQGKTIVLVTHEMGSVEEYCHRAMLINDGKIQPHRRSRRSRPPLPAAEFRTRRPRGPRARRRTAGRRGALLDIWLEEEAGERTTNVEHGAPFHLCAELEALRPLAGIGVGFTVANADGIAVADFGIPRSLDGELPPGRGGPAGDGPHRDREPPGGRALFRPPRRQPRIRPGGVALYFNSALDFAVFGGRPTAGVVALPHEIEADVEPRSRRDRPMSDDARPSPARTPARPRSARCARSPARPRSAAASAASSTCSG